MQFTNQQGLLLNAYSHESGAFKTTALQIAQSVWGHPKKAMQRMDDTENMLFKKAGTIRHLPLFWDEVKGEDQTKRFVSITFKISGGQEKGRLQSSTAVQASGDWATILVAASNDTIMDAISQNMKTTTAGLYRVFEFVVPKIAPDNPGRRTPGTVASMLSALFDNHGRAGEIYSEWLGANAPKLQADVVATIKALETKYLAQEAERYWIATMAVISLGAKYAKELGLVQFDLTTLDAFLGATLLRLRSLVRDERVDMNDKVNVTEVLALYLSAMRARHTIRTDRIYAGKGKPMRGSVKTLSDITRLDELIVHVGEGDKMLRFRSEHFSEWLRTKGYSRKIILDAMKRELGAREVNGVLGGGTDAATLPMFVVEFNIAHTELVWDVA
jgi:hypothetical protein